MKRTVDYTWRLAELMAARGLHNTTDLMPLLAERDITLSRPQVYRLVNQRPERMSLQVLAALCDIFVMDAFGTAHRAADHAQRAPATTPAHAADETSRASRPGGQKAGCASPATSTPCTPAAPAPNVSKTA